MLAQRLPFFAKQCWKTSLAKSTGNFKLLDSSESSESRTRPQICQEPRKFLPLLADPTQVESKKTTQIQWPVESINAELVDIFLEGE